MKRKADYPIPDNDADRVHALRRYGILDSAVEPSYERLTRLASRILDMPISLISLMDEERQWFKSKVGIDASETPRSLAFCNYTICSNTFFQVKDATKDPRFRNNPLVTGGLNIRYYGGAPIRTPDGFVLGTLCAIDTKPRCLSPAQIETLTDCAETIAELIEQQFVTKNAQQSEESLMDAVQAVPDGFVLYDADDRLVVCNDRYRDIYKECADLIKPGVHFADLIRAGVERGQYPAAKDNEEEWIAERLSRHRQGETLVEQELPDDRWLRIEERKTTDGGVVGFRVDITELKRQQRALQQLAWVDSLTKALNRGRFMDLAETEFNRAARYNHKTALIVLDIDRFKSINDTYGHQAGDNVIKEAVTRWKGHLRGNDLIARTGGEEFVVLLPQATLEGAQIAAERLRASIGESAFIFRKKQIPVTVSAGLVIVEPGAETRDEALARADKALYQAKNSGRNRLVLQAA